MQPRAQVQGMKKKTFNKQMESIYAYPRKTLISMLDNIEQGGI